MAAKPDYYRILGVDSQASEQEIRIAFRKKAFEYHPDRNRAADAGDRFKEVNEAYQVLSNSVRRSQYDRSQNAEWERTEKMRREQIWKEQVRREQAQREQARREQAQREEPRRDLLRKICRFRIGITTENTDAEAVVRLAEAAAHPAEVEAPPAAAAVHLAVETAVPPVAKDGAGSSQG